MPLAGAPPVADPIIHGRLHPLGPGKDTITGHWELMGVVTPLPLRTYPDGFPDDVLDALRDATGRGILCNRPYSGTEVIEDFGEQHVRDRRPDRLHVGRLGAADRRARGRRARSPSCTRHARRRARS